MTTTPSRRPPAPQRRAGTGPLLRVLARRLGRAGLATAEQLACVVLLLACARVASPIHALVAIGAVTLVALALASRHLPRS